MTEIHVDPTSLQYPSPVPLFTLLFLILRKEPPTPYVTITTKEKNNNLIKTTTQNL